jgi:uracil-DNA glycosylase
MARGGTARDPRMNREEARFRAIFRRIHAEHPNCLRDEWLSETCRLRDGSPAERPIVWSRRNGPWQHSDLLWIGAAPGNAGGKGAGQLGAHGTRIPFGGDIAGANLDVLLSSIGLDRNRTFIAASYNQLPATGGGEPTVAELAQPVGEYASSVHIVRDTILAVGPRLIVALGNVALRVVPGSMRIESAPKLPSLGQLQRAGFARNALLAWPAELVPDAAFLEQWRAAWQHELPSLLWLTHPSAQNMSPYARKETLFHTRMLEARDALRHAVQSELDWALPEHRPETPVEGIYALPEYRALIKPRHRTLDQLWREKGV